jgi:hypothetical protein
MAIAILAPLLTHGTLASTAQEITISSQLPAELNPPFNPTSSPTGGAPDATPEQAAAFAWQEFIALNWPAGPQRGILRQRDTPNTTLRFGDPTYTGPLVWQTFRGKVEIFPGNVSPFKVVAPPGYPGPPGDKSFGYDALPVYNYSTPIPACNSSQGKDATPWINLDETDQITLDSMFAGIVPLDASPGNSSPRLIRFLAKANRSEYTYAARNSSTTDPSKLWWAAIPKDIVDATKAYLQVHHTSPPADSSTLVSQPNGTVEAKAAWRPLSPAEFASGRFHTQTVRFYEIADGGTKCYLDAKWGLVALHIIQKTPSAPYFIYATFEQADNILTSDGKPVEDAEGRLRLPSPGTTTTPQLCIVDPRPPMITPPPNTPELTSALGSVVATTDPAHCKPAPVTTYCDTVGNQLYLRNTAFTLPNGAPNPNSEPNKGRICVNRRYNDIPDYAIQANAQAHAAIATYLKQAGIPAAPWLSYKLVNVQYFPYDKIPDPKIPNGSPYQAQPPYTAKNPAPSSYYQANIVVETNRSLQEFSGGLSPNISTDWNQDGSPHKNTYYGGHFYNTGGCMGCHGSQGQNPLTPYGAGDFSVILARGTVAQPESPAPETGEGMTPVTRNRSLSK